MNTHGRGFSPIRIPAQGIYPHEKPARYRMQRLESKNQFTMSNEHKLNKISYYKRHLLWGLVFYLYQAMCWAFVRILTCQGPNLAYEFVVWVRGKWRHGMVLIPAPMNPTWTHFRLFQSLWKLNWSYPPFSNWEISREESGIGAYYHLYSYHLHYSGCQYSRLSRIHILAPRPKPCIRCF
jgi:hypothetical protein